MSNAVSKLLVAKVYVDKTIYRMDMAFDYLVPPALAETLKRGCRVVVPFSNSNKKKQGVVVSISEETEMKMQLKTIALQLDKEPIVSEEMFVMIDFLVRNTFCTYYEAVKAILPTGVNVDVVESFKLASSVDSIEMVKFSEEEQRLIEFLRTAKTDKELSAFLDCRVNPAKRPIVKQLLDKGVVVTAQQVNSKVAVKTVKMVKLCDDFIRAGVKLSAKQTEVVKLLLEIGVASVKEVSYLCGCGEAVVRGLVTKQVAEYFQRELQKEYLATFDETITLDSVVLSEAQIPAYDGIMELIMQDKPNVALLHGVTGSGKTQVYIKLIESVLNSGKTAIMLVPEIALTPQMVGKFKSLFGNIVAVIHSSLSLTERLNEFNRIRGKSVKIVIGTRSAIFAPLQNIGVIILDEEGENSYKSESAPRYHAREIAKLRSVNHNATLVLGSATPSIDSYYKAEIGKYTLFTIEDRFNNQALPSVYIVDMQEEQSKQNFSPLSDILQHQIAQNIAQKEQTILLINRRGYNTFATCMQCGAVIKCPHCDVSMTYHKANGQLMCHYCGYARKFEPHCPDCGGAYLKLTGVGTQKVEDEIQLIFPKARVLRMDSDTTYSKDAFEQNFEDFRRQKYDIMLGTQMIAKGLDFPNVTLVGVINADSGLYSDDFKSSERIFSMITQVVGRSGRSEKSGRAYIQTLDPQNSVINYAANQDYRSFYKDEIACRKAMIYPPFCDICVLGFSGLDEKATKKASDHVVDVLIGNAKHFEGITMKILGVTPASIYKMSNKYRYRIIIKCRFNNSFKAFLTSVLKGLSVDKLLNGITVYADINGNING